MFKKLKKNILTSIIAITITLPLFSATTLAQYRDKRNFWQRHRTLITIGGGTLAGAGIGGLAGGRKGALIGGIAGAGGTSIYELIRHKKDNDRRYSYYPNRYDRDGYYDNNRRYIYNNKNQYYRNDSKYYGNQKCNDRNDRFRY